MGELLALIGSVFILLAAIGVVRFDDVLNVHTRCVGAKGARFRFEYLIVRDDGTVVAEGWTNHACVESASLRPIRVPEWLLDAIASAESSSASSSSTA